MNPLRLFSKVAASSPKKLTFDNVGSLAPLAEVSDPVTPEDVKSTTTTTTRKRNQQSSPAASEAGSPPKLPTPGRLGKSKSSTTPRGGSNGSSSSSTGKLQGGHHHRRSLSNLPRLDTGGAASTTTTASDFGPPAAARTLRQSASFSGVSVPRGTGRPPASGDIQSSSPLFTTVVAAPRSAGKPVRYANSSKPTKSVANGYGDEPRIELKEDPMFWMDHSVQVLIRARPLSGAEVARHGVGRCVRQENAHTVSWLGQPETRFTFDHVAGEFVTQEELFRVAGLPMVDNCMAGYNSCMFAYGQTGSGKTHTMLGDLGEIDAQSNENRGMTPRVFEYLFAKILKEEEAQQHAKLKYKCTCSFLELYNEQISDLLEPSSTNLQMREDLNKGVYVEGLLEVEVQNVQDVLHLLLLGATNRKVAATNMNRESSRSHCVFTCVIESQWECDSMINFRFGRLNLVDLAGSERQKATGADGERLREAASINKSLSTLGLVIMVLVDVANGKQRHVPYRDSKLTFLLQDSLGGNSKTTIIANISPSTCASSETLSTLKFAQRAKFIQNNAVINEEASGDVRGLQEQIQQLKDELARIRRQSISRMPNGRISDCINGDSELSSSIENNLAGAKDGFDPLRSSTEGSFLPFARAVLGPTALSHKLKAMEVLLADALRREKHLEKSTAAEIEHLTRMVKHREDETGFHKSLSNHKIRRLSEGPDTHDDNLEYKRLVVENRHLQDQLRRHQEYNAFEERETMIQDISHLREKLLEMLDRNSTMDSTATPTEKVGVEAELAAARQTAEQLRMEVESYRADLSEWRMKLQTSVEANERMSSDLGSLRMELESSREECLKQRRELEILQVKAQEVESLEVKQTQHQQFMFELKTQLQKSEEKAEQEASRRSQLELQLQVALQESTNLQTELQWTKDALEEAEGLVETLQRNEPVLEIGDPGGSYEAFMIGQLQAEIMEMHKRLEDERKRGRDLEVQIAREGKKVCTEETDVTTTHIRNLSTDSCDATGQRRVRHHDAIMQLQMELESLDGGSPSASRDAIKGYRWEEGTRDEEAELKHSVTIMQLQLDMESLEGALAESKASSEILQQKLEATEAELANVRAGSALHDAVIKATGDMEKMQEALVVAREHFNLERQTLVAAVADAEERYSIAKGELVVRHEELHSLEDRCQRAEARELVVQAVRVKLEEDLVKLKEQQEDWFVEKSELEARCVDKDKRILDLETTIKANLHVSRCANESTVPHVTGLRNQFSARHPKLEKKLANMTAAMEELTRENSQLQQHLNLLRTEAEVAQKVVRQKEEELAPLRRSLADMENRLEQEDSRINALTLSITSSAGKSWGDHAEKENVRKSAGGELVKSTDRSLRALTENRKPRRLSDGGGRPRLQQSETVRVSADRNTKLGRAKALLESKEQLQQQQELGASKAELQAAMGETERYKTLAQQCEAEMERLTLLLLETEERHIKAEQSWREEKSHLQAYRHEAELEAATKKLKLPARIAKMERWRRQVHEADSLMSVLVHANEKAKQESSFASNTLLEELVGSIASIKEQLDATMTHAENEIRGLMVETRLLKSELLDSCKAAFAEQETTIHNLQAEVSKARKQTWSLQADQGATVRALHEKEETIMKLLNEVNHLQKQAESRSVSLRQCLTRQSLTKEQGYEPALRRSFSCKLIEEKEMTLTVLKEETDFLKTLVFTLDTENAELQQQILDFEAETTALKSTIANLERESKLEPDNTTQALMQKLHESSLRVAELECQRSELRDEMQRQAESFAALYAELQKQEDMVRIDESKADEDRSLLEALEQEKVELKAMVERLDAECTGLKQALQQERMKREADVQSKQELEAERDKLETDLSLFMEQLETAQAMADEARKMAELSKTRAEEKQVEVEILGRSVEELENTVYALESQVGLLKRECDNQRLLREEMESELQGLKHQVSILHAALTEASSRSGDELVEMKMRREDAERMLEEREVEMQLLRNKLEKLQMGIEGCKVPTVELAVQHPPPMIQPLKKGHHTRSGSAFIGCIKMNHQVHSELEEERRGYQRRIQELEDVLQNHEDEVTMLHEKLADAETMTRDVLRVLRGVKTDMTNVVTLLDEQEEEEGKNSDTRSLQKDEEIEQILTRLNDFIEERESWLEMISKKQAELVASQAAVETLREREKSLMADLKKLKIENRTQLKKIGHLEQENKTLSGQQNLQQRIKHHARIKEENNTLRVQNTELSSKLRRAEHLSTRVSEELAKHRTAQGKPAAINVEEEERLRTLLQEVQELRDAEAQKLAKLCSNVIRAAGLTVDGDTPAVALEAVEHLKDHLETTRQEFEDFKLKTRILGERQKLNELRTANSPLRGIDPQLTPR